MTIAQNNQIKRAWLLLKVPEANPKQLRNLSGEIFTAVETAYPGDTEEMVMRADVTEGDYDLVVSISASDQDNLDAITDIVAAEVAAVDGSGTVERAVVDFYNPYPATVAACYVTDSEAFNPPKGKNKQGTGYNAWG